MNKQTEIAVQTYNKIAAIYTNQYFNDTSDLPYIDTFLQLLPKRAKVLDVGSGPGQFAKYMQSKEFDVIGIDLSDEMLTVARKKVPEVRFEKMDMLSLNYKWTEPPKLHTVMDAV